MSSLVPVLSLAANIGTEVVRRIGEVRLERERRKTQMVVAAGAIGAALISGVFIGIEKYRASRKRSIAAPDPERD